MLHVLADDEEGVFCWGGSNEQMRLESNIKALQGSH